MSERAQSSSTLAKTARGTAWVVAWRMGTRTLGVISTLFLVRLLLPSDFGLLALALSFTQSVEALSWFGIEDALVRERDPQRSLYDTAFTLQLIRAITLTLLIMAAARPAAAFFNEPRLAVVVFALAFANLLDGFNNIGTVDFRRQFDFHLEFRLWIVPRFLGTVFVVVLAAITHSYWALVASVVVNRCLKLAAGYIMHPYRPRLGLQNWRHLMSYSLWTWLSGIIGILAGQSDTFMVGRLLDSTRVGFYSLGMEMASLPNTELVEPLGRSTFSAFSESRRLGQSAAPIWLRLCGSAALLVIPSAIGISIVAPNFLRVGFGAGWDSSVPVLQTMALFSATGLFGAVSGAYLYAYGMLRQIVLLRAVLVALRLALLALLLPRLGLQGAALAIGISAAIEQFAVSAMACHQLRIGLFRDVVPVLWRCLAATAVMAGVIQALGLGWGADFDDLSPYLALFGVALLGALLYLATLVLLWWLCGKPDGPETDILALARQGLAKAASVLGRAKPQSEAQDVR